MRPLPVIMRGVVLAMLLSLSVGFMQPAAAQGAASCSANMGGYGFTAGLVFCIREEISDATNLYITQLSSGMAPYKYAAFTLAIMLFGIKLVTVGSEHFAKDATMLLFKMAVILFLIDNASSLYNSLTQAMDQMIGWVSIGFVPVSKNASCTPLGGDLDPNIYAVWHTFDCIGEVLFGFVANNPGKILLGISVVLMAAFFTSILGVILLLVAVTSIVGAIIMLARAIYTVLLSYLALAFMMVLTPLIAPLLVFESRYLKGIFDKWMGLIISTLFQPLFIVGFLSVAAMTIGTFVEGTAAPASGGSVYPALIPMGAPNGCVIPPHVTIVGGECIQPPADAPEGSGICSFQQLFYPDGMSEADRKLAMHCLLEENATLFSWTMGGDPQGHSDDGKPLSGSWWQKIKSAVVNKAQQLLALAGNLAFGGVTRLKSFAPIKQLMMTMVAFGIITVVMLKLMYVIPEMARAITVSVGISLFREARVPLEGTISASVKGAGDAMKLAARSAGGGFKGVMSMPRIGLKGLQGGYEGAKKQLTDKYIQ